MTTKYNIGDILVVVDYYNNVFASNIIAIEIKDEIVYTLDKMTSTSEEENVRVCETPDDNSYYRILKLAGTID